MYRPTSTRAEPNPIPIAPQARPDASTRSRSAAESVSYTRSVTRLSVWSSNRWQHGSRWRWSPKPIAAEITRMGAGARRRSAPTELPEILRDAHAFGVAGRELAQLAAVQSRPAPEQRREELVANRHLLGEVVGLHRCEIVGEVLHAEAIPCDRSAETRLPLA